MKKRIPPTYKKYLVGNYAPSPAIFVKAKGARLKDKNKKRYIDFASGVAVTSLGHNFTPLTNALNKQANKLMHLSNLYIHDLTISTAKKLIAATKMEQVFFCNSGAEANEAALKIARKFGLQLSKNKFKIISFDNSFHGRIGFSLAASAQQKLWKDFGPLAPGFIHLPFNDTNKLNIAMNKNVCAVIIELIQGEGGLSSVKPSFIKLINKLCQKHNALLIIDEVQTGAGRTGDFLASFKYPISPDIVTLGKGIGGGYPVAATVIANRAKGVLFPGDHGTTYGGNAMSMAAVSTVIKHLNNPKIKKNVIKISKQINNYLQKLIKQGAPIKSIKGDGLLIGIELKKNYSNIDLAREAFSLGLLTVPAGQNVLRILPPLNISTKDTNDGLKILKTALINLI